MLSFSPKTQLFKEKKFWMFKEKLLPRYRNMMSVYMRHTFKEVFDISMMVEMNYLAAQSGIHTQSQTSSSSQARVVLGSGLKSMQSEEGKSYGRIQRP